MKSPICRVDQNLFLLHKKVNDLRVKNGLSRLTFVTFTKRIKSKYFNNDRELKYNDIFIEK